MGVAVGSGVGVASRVGVKVAVTTITTGVLVVALVAAPQAAMTSNKNKAANARKKGFMDDPPCSLSVDMISNSWILMTQANARA